MPPRWQCGTPEVDRLIHRALRKLLATSLLAIPDPRGPFGEGVESVDRLVDRALRKLLAIPDPRARGPFDEGAETGAGTAAS